MSRLIDVIVEISIHAPLTGSDSKPAQIACKNLSHLCSFAQR